MFSAVGLFLGLKSKISYKQNVIYFQFYIRLPNFRLLRLIVFKKSPIRSIPLSILYRLFFETQGRKYGRILSWSCFHALQNIFRCNPMNFPPGSGCLTFTAPHCNKHDLLQLARKLAQHFRPYTFSQPFY